MRFRIELYILVTVFAASCKATFGDVSAEEDLPADASIDTRAIDARDDASVDPVPCPAGPERAQDPATGHCYTVITEPATWNAAQEACAALSPNTHLAVSTSQQENDVMSPLAGLADVWIGGTDFLSEDEFIWLNGEPMIFQNFRSGEPNNGGLNGEDCLVLEGDNGGLWDDRACTSTFGYICERE